MMMTTLRADDGSRDVPTSVPDPVTSVIVVGAGVAGLTAARALYLAGVPVTVVEGRDRLGGRTHTVDVAGVPVDLGASWVTHKVDSPLIPLFKRLDVRMLDAKITEVYAAAECLNLLTDTYPDTTLRDDVLAAFQAFESGAGRFVRGIDESVSVESGLAELLPQFDPVTLATLGSFLSVFDAADPDEIGLLNVTAFLLDQATEDQDAFPEGGYRRLVAGLAADLDIRLSTRVTAISEGPTGLTVSVDAGDGTARSDLAASHTIVTAPLGVLRAGSISFEPALDRGRLKAFEVLEMGNFEKVALAYDAASWRRTGATGIVAGHGGGRQWHSVIDLGRWYQGATVVVAVAAGEKARALASSSQEQRVDSAHDLMRRTSDSTALPTASASSGWAKDPFSLGSYSRLPLGVTAAEGVAAIVEMGRPHGRVLFAGEATSQTHPSVVDGAFLSGIREAKRLLQTPDVAVL